MKYKILSVIICMMLLTTFFAVAENFDENEPNKIKEDDLPLNFDDANVAAMEFQSKITSIRTDRNILIRANGIPIAKKPLKII